MTVFEKSISAEEVEMEREDCIPETVRAFEFVGESPYSDMEVRMSVELHEDGTVWFLPDEMIYMAEGEDVDSMIEILTGVPYAGQNALLQANLELETKLEFAMKKLHEMHREKVAA